MTTVAVLGTGTMGAGMARSLLREGMAVRAWNRTPERAAPLASDGAQVCTSVARAVDGADVVLLMVFDTAAVLDVLGEIAAADSTSTVIQASTIGPDGAAQAAQLAKSHSLPMLDAPVLGTRQPAEDGKLVVLASGDPELRSVAQPVFDAIGSRTMWVGDELGQASALKLACNSWVATLTAAAAQALSMARAAGLDPQLVLEAIGGGPVDTPYLQGKGKMMIAGSFDPAAFALDGVRKDLNLMIGMAGGLGLPSGMLQAALDRFDAASGAGHGAEDMAAVITGF